MSDDMEMLHQAFFEEAAELIAQMENTFLALETTPEDQELLNTIFRCVHSIKGAAGMFGFTEVSQFAHGFESVLDRLRHREIIATPPLIDLLLRASDVLKALVAQLRGAGAVDAASRDTVAAELQHILTGQTGELPSTPAPAPSQAPPAASATRGYEVYFKPGADIFQKGLDPLQIFEELGRLGEALAVEVEMGQLPPLAAMDPEQCYLGWTIRLGSALGADALQEPFEFVRDDSVLRITEVEPLPPDTAPGPQPTNMPFIGELLVQDQVVTPEQVEAALAKQKKVGELLVG